ncbi:uncharacterized protein G2W53_038121 [Senna tora]|uniref:Uncharacterized protein n=1 Tax=Senna tora TaxID=362788 RepID=A0A834SKF0_9FABA|nr:uncharacterized protein G2W53_044755 [Senna tora]KAF7805960.1 uncharacterized protein G2W53_038121 [Senna tora]
MIEGQEGGHAWKRKKGHVYGAMKTLEKVTCGGRRSRQSWRGVIGLVNVSGIQGR